MAGSHPSLPPSLPVCLTEPGDVSAAPSGEQAGPDVLGDTECRGVTAGHSSEARQERQCGAWWLQSLTGNTNWALRWEPIIRHDTACCDQLPPNFTIILRHENKRCGDNVFDQAEKEVKDFSSLKFCSQSSYGLCEQSVCGTANTVEILGGISPWHHLETDTLR